MITHVFSRAARGQGLVELALVLPWFLMVLFGIIVLGMGVFYQQQLTHAAREAARYASIHSATAVNPTTSNLPIYPTIAVDSNNSIATDTPARHWPDMTNAAKESVFGLDRDAIGVSACWSGYEQVDASGVVQSPPVYDAAPVNGTGLANVFHNCTIRSVNPDTGVLENIDPRTSTDAAGVKKPIGCTTPMPTTTGVNDTASNLAWSQYASANEVTVFACYIWRPPLAGFLLIPQEVILRAVVTEAMQHQK